jgi:hypothetical protein
MSQKGLRESRAITGAGKVKSHFSTDRLDDVSQILGVRRLGGLTVVLACVLGPPAAPALWAAPLGSSRAFS